MGRVLEEEMTRLKAAIILDRGKVDHCGLIRVTGEVPWANAVWGAADTYLARWSGEGNDKPGDGRFLPLNGVDLS